MDRPARPILLVTGFVLLTTAAAQAAPEARVIAAATRFYASGMHALRAGNLSKAHEAFSTAVERVPYFPEALLGLGHVAMAQRRFDDALRVYRSALEGYGQMGTSLYDLRVRRYTEAQREIADLQGKMAQLTSLAANARTDPRKVERAMMQVQEQIRMLESIPAPSRDHQREPPSEAYFHLGNAYFHVGRVEDAVREWETCAAKAERFSFVQNNLAVGYWKLGRLDEAQSAVARAEALGFRVDPAFRTDLERSLQLAREAGASHGP
jgi:tetratricopeptide (TPR) repeat protein